MRYGLYQLKKAPERRNDWVYILDHTIEFGKKQCLLVLGISLEKLRRRKCKLRHNDMTVLAIDIIDSATGQSVTDCLLGIANKTGFPVQIVSDGGANILNGCRYFANHKDCQHEIRQTYDVTHKAALILKHQLKNDKMWKSFCSKIAFSKGCLVHTELGYLVSPKPRDKSRWQNLDPYIKWAEMILNQYPELLSKANCEKFKDRLSWVEEYKPYIEEWRLMLKTLQAVQYEIKHNGLSNKTVVAVKKALDIPETQSQRLSNIKSELTVYVEDACKGLNGTFLGCSDIIESIFGKYKNFSGKSSMKEIGRAILTIPAFVGKIKHDEVKQAMESISAKEVSEWQKENIGISFLSKRKKAFNFRNPKTG